MRQARTRREGRGGLAPEKMQQGGIATQKAGGCVSPITVGLPEVRD